MTIKISDIFDLDLFHEMHDQRYVNVQTDVGMGLSIANYSSNAQFDRVWNDVTMNCRGLIFDADTLEVVARGYKKFFNWDDSSQPYPPTGPMLRAPKMDGSLGILYPTPDCKWAIATRGSFTSDQAIKATDMFNSIWEKTCLEADGFPWNLLPSYHPNQTYLFEIIYPENRIVVNYGNAERLVLLDVLDTDTGKANISLFDEFAWPDKAEKIVVSGGFKDTMAGDIPPGEEGFVLYWPQKDFRTKMKAAEYLELHRMIFGFNERMVWERMGEGESVESIAEQLPDEFHQWIKDVAAKLNSQFNQAMWQTVEHHSDIMRKVRIDAGQREFAAECEKLATPLRGWVFAYHNLDKRDRVKDMIWKTLRPFGGKGIMLQSEDVA